MSSEIKANKLSPATGTALEIGDSGDTVTLSGTGAGFPGFNKWTPVTATDTTFDLQSGTTILIVEVQAAGGHGGTSDGGTRTGGGGGGGAYAKKLLTGMSDTDTLNITIGAAAGVAASGTTTSVASASGTSFTTITCTGGAGGTTASGGFGSGGAGGAVPTTGDLNIAGNSSPYTDHAQEPVPGGDSMFGWGGRSSSSLTVAEAGKGYGSGGQGGRGNTNAGAAGTPGIVIIWEYK